MRLAIVSDAHLHDPRSARQGAFGAFLDALRVDRLVLLGDIFHAWGGLHGSPPAAVAPACAALRRVRDRGVAVTFVPGNHELRAGPYLRARLGFEVRGVHTDRSSGGGIVLAHGDEADSRPGYRLTRRLLKGRAFSWGLERAGVARAQRVLDGLAGSAQAGEGRDPRLVALQRAWGQRRITAEARAVALGHSHIAALHDVPGGLIVHTGAWAGLRTWIRVGAGRIALMRWTGAGSEVLDARPWPPTG